MTIPDYQEFMHPFLILLKDNKEHSLQEAYSYLSEYFNLSESDKKELLPSGKQLVYQNRIGWARTYLKNAGLLNIVKRGTFRITDRGISVISNSNIKRIDKKFLSQYKEFQSFTNKKSTLSSKISNDSDEQKLSPREEMDINYQLIKDQVSSEILEKVKKCTSEFFERLVVELLVAMGYGGSMQDAGKAIGKSGDEGIDGIIKEDVLGLDKIYVQAKKWENIVGRPEIQKFAGSLEGQRAKKGIFITTSDYTSGAKDYINRIEKNIILIDGIALADLMFNYNIGVSTIDQYVLKKIDLDFYEE